MSQTCHPRRPRRSPLYRLLEDPFEDLLLSYEEQLQRQYGTLRPGIRKTVYKFLDCGILEHGFARVVCPQCKADFLVAYSCRVRILCPSCHVKRLTIWGEWLWEEFLGDVPHRMITLTLPTATL